MQDKGGEHPFGDTGQLILLGLFLIVWLGDSFFLHLSTFLAHWIPLSVRLVFLGLLLLTAVYLVPSGHSVISQKQRPNHVVASGAFRYVRHPLYLASLLTYLGLAISTLSLFSLGVWIGIFGFYDYIASYEERLLQAKFGEAYHDYKKKTGKWRPRLRQGR